MTKYWIFIGYFHQKNKYKQKRYKKSTKLDKFPILCNILWIRFMSLLIKLKVHKYRQMQVKKAALSWMLKTVEGRTPGWFGCCIEPLHLFHPERVLWDRTEIRFQVHLCGNCSKRSRSIIWAQVHIVMLTAGDFCSVVSKLYRQWMWKKHM